MIADNMYKGFVLVIFTVLTSACATTRLWTRKIPWPGNSK